MTMRLAWGIVALALLPACQQQERSSYRPTGLPVPDTALVFGVHPHLGPQDLNTTYGPILRHLGQQMPGTVFRLEASRDFPEFERKLHDRRFHFAVPNAFQAAWSLRHGYRVLAEITPQSGLTGVIVTRADARIERPSDLRGKTLSFPAATALAATLMPLLYLQERGLDVNRDIDKRYVGGHHSAILNVYTGDAAAAGVWRGAWEAWTRQNPDKAAAMRVLWETPALPNLGLIVRSDVEPALARRVMEHLAAMGGDPIGRGILDHAGLIGFRPASEADFAPLAEFLDRYDSLIGLPAPLKDGHES